jgi:hypothetical protein
MPKVTPGDETKGVSARKPVVKLPRLRLPNVVFHRNNTNNVNSTGIPDKPYPKYDLQILHVDDRVIIKAPVVNPTRTLIPQNQVKNKSDLDKSDIITIPAKVNSINQINIPAKVNQSNSTDTPAEVDSVKQTNIPVKPMNVKSNSTPTPVHFLQFIKLLETISSSSIYFPIPPIVEAEQIHLNKLQTHLIHTANKLRTALRVFDFLFFFPKIANSKCQSVSTVYFGFF